MRTTRNITLAIPEEIYREARSYVVRRGMSLSYAVRYLLSHLPKVDQAVRKLAEDPDFGAPPKSSPCASPSASRAEKNCEKCCCETVKQDKATENEKLAVQKSAPSQNL